MRDQGNRKRPFDVEYTNKPLSGWGGLLPFFEFCERSSLIDYLRAGLPDGRTSNNQVTPVDIVRTLMATVLIGGSRFAHVDRIREDAVIRQIVSARRLAGADSVRRYFSGFTASQNEHLYETLQQAVWKVAGETERQDVLDLDSTILDRFGSQQGVAKGYHPTRKGRRSHHPLLAMLANAKMIVHCWLRAGGASTHRGALEFTDELLARTPAGTRVTAVRADSGFFSKEYLKGFEERGLPYAISMKLSRPVQRFCASIQNERWEPFDDDEVADTLYHPPQWPAPRRVVLVRSRVQSNDATAALFDVPSYEYRAIVTDLDLQPAELVRFYNKRGDCENRIKEFKNDFGARGFCLSSFTATETVLRLLSVLYNLVTAFKVQVLHDVTVTLATIRNTVFVVGASLGSSGRRTILRLGLTASWRTRFDQLLARARALSLSTAAQSAKALAELLLHPPSPWRARRPTTAIL